MNNEFMARRGDQLREHILWIAKDVFLEFGFERASMDLVAGRAQTSKRSLYAHFENKEKLFLAVIEFVRGLFLGRLKMPEDYSEEPLEALVAFCGRYLEVLLYEPTVQMMRVSMAEADRFPEQAAQYFDVLFTEVHSRLSGHLRTNFGFSANVGAELADKLLSQVLYPQLLRALFGMDQLAKSLDGNAAASESDLKLLRKAVVDLVESIPKH